LVGWNHFPQHKGRITGLIICGFGFGTTIFNLIGTKLINPDNKSASIDYDGDKYFEKSIADNVPSALRTLSLCYLAISVIGILLIGNRVVEEEKDSLNSLESDDNCPDLKTALKTSLFWKIFFIGLLGNIPGLYVATAYKTFGSSEISNDDFLAVTGSLGAVFNGIFRYVWPQIMDKTTFKSTILVLFCIQISLISSFYFTPNFPAMFLIWVCGIYACEGGLATLFPSVIAKCFGKL
jgi:Major Facilitator Superfamily